MTEELREVPFLPEWTPKILSLEKFATSRRHKLGDVGDRFVVEDRVFEFALVGRIRLADVRRLWYLAEGCATPEEFEDVWARIHPTTGFRPYESVWLHLWKPLKGDA